MRRLLNLNTLGMAAAHRHGHAPDAAGQRAAPEQAAAMQRLNRCAFLQPQFAQTLTLCSGQLVPIDRKDGGGLTQGKFMQAQDRAGFRMIPATDYQYASRITREGFPR